MEREERKAVSLGEIQFQVGDCFVPRNDVKPGDCFGRASLAMTVTKTLLLPHIDPSTQG